MQIQLFYFSLLGLGLLVTYWGSTLFKFVLPIIGFVMGIFMGLPYGIFYTVLFALLGAILGGLLPVFVISSGILWAIYHSYSSWIALHLSNLSMQDLKIFYLVLFFIIFIIVFLFYDVLIIVGLSFIGTSLILYAAIELFAGIGIPPAIVPPLLGVLFLLIFISGIVYQFYHRSKQSVAIQHPRWLGDRRIS